MLLFAVVTVFIAGLMVGRTPEYLGKKIGAREVKLAMLGVLIMPAGLLVTLGIAAVVHAGVDGPLNTGPHGFSEMFYALASAGNNNGSAFAGLTGATTSTTSSLGVAMLLGRFAIIVPVLAWPARWRASRRVPWRRHVAHRRAVFVGLLSASS